MARFGALRIAAVLIGVSSSGCTHGSGATRALAAFASADPVIVRGFAAGSASHGPHCRAPFASAAFDRECALVYAIDASGQFRQIREYRDPRSPFVATTLELGGDGRVYGVTSVVGTANEEARPTLFRYTPRSAHFEIVRRFAPDDRVLGIGKFSVDARGVAYAFATVDEVRDRADLALLRVTSNGWSQVARFGNAEPVGRPLVGADGTITATLASRKTCFGTRVRFARVGNEDAVASYRSSATPAVTGCRAPAGTRELRTPEGDRVALYAQRLVRFGRSRIETIGLPVGFGHFAGAPVPVRGGTAYALAAGSNGDVCMRLVRVASGGVDVLHTFRHADGWCLPPSICLFPRVRGDGERFDVTSSRGAPCASAVTLARARSFDGAFGAVAHLGPRGALRFAYGDPR